MYSSLDRCCLLVGKIESDLKIELRNQIAQIIKMSSKDQVRASHILIKHEGSRRKASWKDPEGIIIKNTTQENAVAQLRRLRDAIITGKSTFNDIAAEYSDCSSAKDGGDLGKFGRKKMQKAFEDVAFRMKVGEISDIVETDSGVHIILRTE